MALGHSCGWSQTTMRMVPCLTTDNGTWTQLWLVTDYHENGSLFDYRQWHLDTAVVGDRLPWEWLLVWLQTMTFGHSCGRWQTTMRMAPCLTTDNDIWTQLWLVTDYHENGSLFDYRQWHLATAVVGDRLPWEWFLVWLQTMALGHSCGWWQTTMIMVPCLTTDNGTWTQLWLVTDYHENGSLFDYRQWHLDTAVVGDRLPWEWLLVWLQTMALGHSCGWWQTTMRMAPCLITDNGTWTQLWLVTDYHENGSLFDYRQWHLDTAMVGHRLPWEWLLVWLQTMALGHSCGWWQTTMRMAPCLTTDNGTWTQLWLVTDYHENGSLFDYRQWHWTQLWLVTDYHENGSLFDYRQWHLDTAVVGDRLPWEWLLVWLQTMALGPSCGWWQTTMRMAPCLSTDNGTWTQLWLVTDYHENGSLFDYRQWHLDTAMVGDRLPWEWLLVWLQTMALGHSCVWWQTTMIMVPCLITDNGTWTQLWLVTDYHDNGSLFDYRQWHLDTAVVGHRLPWEWFLVWLQIMALGHSCGWWQTTMRMAPCLTTDNGTWTQLWLVTDYHENGSLFDYRQWHLDTAVVGDRLPWEWLLVWLQTMTFGHSCGWWQTTMRMAPCLTTDNGTWTQLWLVTDYHENGSLFDYRQWHLDTAVVGDWLPWEWLLVWLQTMALGHSCGWWQTTMRMAPCLITDNGTWTQLWLVTDYHDNGSLFDYRQWHLDTVVVGDRLPWEWFLVWLQTMALGHSYGWWQTTMRMAPCLTTDNDIWTQLWLVTDYHENGSLFDYRQWHLDTAVVGDRLPWEWFLVWLQTMALGHSCGWWQTTMRMAPCLTTDNGTWTQLWLVTDYHENGSLFDYRQWHLDTAVVGDRLPWEWLLVWLQTMALGHSCGWWQTTMRMVPCLTTDNGTWTQLWLVTDYHENGSLFDYRQWHLDTAVVGDRLPWEWLLVWLQTMALGHSYGWWQTTMRMAPCLTTDNDTWTQLWLVTDYHENGSLFDYRQWHLDTAMVGDRLPWEWFLVWLQTMPLGHSCGWWQTTMRMVPCLITDNGTWTQLWLVTDYHENGSLFDYRQWHLDTAVVGDRLPWEWFLVWLQTMALGHSCGWWQTTMRMVPCLTTDNGTWTQLWLVTDYHENGSLFDYRQWHLDTAVVGHRLPWEWLLVWLQTMALGHSCGWWQTTMRMVPCLTTDSGTWTQLWLVTDYHENGSLFDYRQWHLDTAVVGDRLPWEWFLVCLQTMALGHSCGWWQTTMRMVPCLTTDSGTWTQLWLVTDYHENGSLFDYRQWHLDTAMVGDRLPWEWFLVCLQTMALGHSCGWWQTTMRMVPCLTTDSGTWTQLWLVTDYHENGSLFDYRQWHLNTAVVGDRLPWEWFLVWLQTMTLGHSYGWWQTTMRMAPCLTTDNGTWTQLWLVTDYHDNGSLFDYRQWHLDTAVVSDRLPWEWFLVWLQTMALGHSCGWWQTTMRMAPCLITDNDTWTQLWLVTDYHENGSLFDYRQWHLDTAVVSDRLPW